MKADKSDQKSIELKDVYQVLTDIQNTLKESLIWTRLVGIKEIKPVLEDQLSDDPAKLIYQLSDGTKGTQEIARMIKDVSYSTVFRYWKQWEKVGIGESITVVGGSRFKRLFDLEDFGIKIPEIPKSMGKTEQSLSLVEQKSADQLMGKIQDGN